MFRLGKDDVKAAAFPHSGRDKRVALSQFHDEKFNRPAHPWLPGLRGACDACGKLSSATGSEELAAQEEALRGRIAAALMRCARHGKRLALAGFRRNRHRIP
jgi:hypothetical protein